MTFTILRRAAALTAAVVFLIILGCVSEPVTPAHGFRQTGQVFVASEAEKDIYFPTPYAQPPLVQLHDESVNDVQLVECRTDHFRIINRSFADQKVSWTATGERGVPAPAPPLNSAPAGK